MRKNKHGQESSKDNKQKSLFQFMSKNPRPSSFDIKNPQSFVFPKSNGPEPCQKCHPAPKFLYPKNPEIRQYQFIISRTCVQYNTMVCLPTGLGKTHIASVVMLNYYLWFPTGKIYFLAPTRPLVFQQKRSLASFQQLINPEHIVEINGQYPKNKRKAAYDNKRVFFMTPQTLLNDIDTGSCDPTKTVLIIVDEAHRSVGNYAYVGIVKLHEEKGYGYRLVGLSATPGNDLEKVQVVIDNLKIARLQAKDDNDPDVKPYIHTKQITPVEIRATGIMVEAENIIDEFIEKPLNLLISLQIIPGFLSKLAKTRGLSKGTHFQMMEAFRNAFTQHQLVLSKQQIAMAYGTFKITRLLVDLKGALKQQGFDSFQSYLSKFEECCQNAKESSLLASIRKSDKFQRLKSLFDKNSKHITHPKLAKIKELLTEFYANPINVSRKSKAIIFTGQRTSALEIKNYLDKVNSEQVAIKSALFVGQAKTVNYDSSNQENSCSVIQLRQKEQIKVIEQFKNNEINVLVSTSIGEEGLDIGEVDLIICYDGGMSPIRMVQRMGRTGRKRDGIVYLLLMEGKEFSKFEQATSKSKSLKVQLKNNSKKNPRGAVSVAKVNAKDSKKGAVNNDIRFYSFNSCMLPQGTELAVEYIDNKEVKQLQPIKVSDSGKKKKKESKTSAKSKKEKGGKKSKKRKDQKQEEKEQEEEEEQEDDQEQEEDTATISDSQQEVVSSTKDLEAGEGHDSNSLSAWFSQQIQEQPLDASQFTAELCTSQLEAHSAPCAKIQEIQDEPESSAKKSVSSIDSDVMLERLASRNSR